MGCLVPPAAGKDPGATDNGPRTTDDAQDFVFLGEARPVLVRVHALADGKPLRGAADEFFKTLFNYLDVNGDGVLDKNEAERAPSLDQVMSGGVAGGFGFGGFGRESARPALKDLDGNNDGKVTREELADYYRKSGFATFQFQLDAPAPSQFNIAAIIGGGRGEPTVEAVRESVFNLLDTNRDGKLSKAELAAAASVLMKLDEDDDEALTAKELTPDYEANPIAMAMSMMGRRGKKDGPATNNSVVVPAARPGEVPEGIVRRLQERYGPASDKPAEKKLARKDLGLDEGTFARLDANKDGTLDAKELAAFTKRDPDLELVLRFGTKGAKEARVEVRRCPLADKVALKEALAFLDLGLTRAEFRADDSKREDRLGTIVSQQYLTQFRQADKDNNGVLDEQEAKSGRLFRNLFKAMDRDGDGKLTEKEVTAYLDAYGKIRDAGTAACVTLVLSDESRGLFDLLDADRDGRLGVRELARAPMLLEKLDRSGRGAIAKEDVPRSYRMTVRRGPATTAGLGGAAAFAELYTAGYAEETEAGPTAGPAWFRKMDRNRDGDVSRKEFLGTAAQFREIDADGDGLISTAEANRYDAKRRAEK